MLDNQVDAVARPQPGSPAQPGNFEALMGYPGKKPILFILKSKCRPVAR